MRPGRGRRPEVTSGPLRCPSLFLRAGCWRAACTKARDRGRTVLQLFSEARGKNLFLDLTEFSMLSLAANPTMNRLAQLGRYFFAIPFAAFGVQYYLYGYYSG